MLKHNEIIKKKIRKLVMQSTIPIKDIAKKFNVHEETIRRWNKKWGFKRPQYIINKIREKTCKERFGCKNVHSNIKVIKKYIKTIRKLSKNKKSIFIDIDKLKKLANEKLTLKEIAEKLGTRDTNVCHLLKKYKIKRRKETLSYIRKRAVKRNKNITDKIKKENYYNNTGYYTPAQNPKVKEKREQTNLKKYGVKNTFQSEKIKKKSIKTNLKKYGTKYATQSKIIKEKTILHNQRKYGVNYTIFLKKAKNSLKLLSKPNKIFAELLDKYKIKYEREYSIGHYLYDFKVDKMLIEINPSTTHNSTFGIHKDKPKSKKYHFNKTKLANDNGFKCICIWDWDDSEKIVKAIKNGKLKIIKSDDIMCHYYNLKSREHKIIKDKKTNKSNHWVKIYDDKQKIVY